MPEVAASCSVELTVVMRVLERVDHIVLSAVVLVALLLSAVVEPSVVDSTWIVENACAPVQSGWTLMWEHGKGKKKPVTAAVLLVVVEVPITITPLVES